MWRLASPRPDCVTDETSMAQSEENPRQFGAFLFPQIHDNSDGWGPSGVPEQFKDTPYQPFSKDDRLGKVRMRRGRKP